MANIIYQTMLKRRSIRHFKEQKVEKDKIDVILKAAMSAPSACNMQPWEFIVIDDEIILDKLKKASPLGNYNAPLFILICGIHKHLTTDLGLWKFDCGLAAENLMLECVELGLGSVCVAGFDHKEVQNILEIPDEIIPLCFIEIGYPNEEKEPMSWYDEKAVSWNKYNHSKNRVLHQMKSFDPDIVNKIKVKE